MSSAARRRSRRAGGRRRSLGRLRPARQRTAMAAVPRPGPGLPGRSPRRRPPARRLALARRRPPRRRPALRPRQLPARRPARDRDPVPGPRARLARCRAARFRRFPPVPGRTARRRRRRSAARCPAHGRPPRGPVLARAPARVVPARVARGQPLPGLVTVAARVPGPARATTRSPRWRPAWAPRRATRRGQASLARAARVGPRRPVRAVPGPARRGRLARAVPAAPARLTWPGPAARGPAQTACRRGPLVAQVAPVAAPAAVALVAPVAARAVPAVAVAAPARARPGLAAVAVAGLVPVP